MTPRAEIVCFSTGAVRTKRGERGVRRYLPGGWRSETMPVNVFAVDHPAGLCLFDTGQTVRAATSGYFPAWWPFFRLARFELDPEDEAADQLARFGLGDRTVRWIVLSHLHTDHAGGLGRLHATEVLVSRLEWQRAVGLRGRLRGYLPQYWPSDLEPRLIDFNATPIGPFAGSCDLANDGLLRLVPTPGHTPGHMSLIADVDGGRVLMGGDLCRTARQLAEVAPAISTFCRREKITPLMTHDPEACSLATSPRSSTRGS